MGSGVMGSTNVGSKARCSAKRCSKMHEMVGFDPSEVQAKVGVRRGAAGPERSAWESRGKWPSHVTYASGKSPSLLPPPELSLSNNGITDQGAAAFAASAKASMCAQPPPGFDGSRLPAPCATDPRRRTLDLCSQPRSTPSNHPRL